MGPYVLAWMPWIASPDTSIPVQSRFWLVVQTPFAWTGSARRCGGEASGSEELKVRTSRGENNHTYGRENLTRDRQKLCDDKWSDDMLCDDKLWDDKLCDDKLYVSKLCV